MNERFRTTRPNLILGLTLLALLLQCVAAPAARSAEPPPIAQPQSVGMNAQKLSEIQSLVTQAIDDDQLPGAVVCVGRHGKIVYLEAIGNRQVGDDPLPMTTDTVFDMASITKPVATATSIMKLVENGRLQLNDRVSKFFPDFAVNGKDPITIENLLLHQSGLIPDNAMSDYRDGPEKAWQRICDLKLTWPIGEIFKYSDVNFIVLAKLVEKISGKDVNEFSHDEIFAPLGMSETGYNPVDELKIRAAPTQRRDGEWMRGEVHDPRAFALSGIAGHAGLFSTANDMSIYARMMLGEGAIDRNDQPVRVLKPETVREMTSHHRVSSGLRGLGWDIQSPYSSNRGDSLSPSAYGHGGFTGTVLWIDPELDLFFIFLSNRVHPDGTGSVNQLSGRILDVVASSVSETSETRD